MARRNTNIVRDLTLSLSEIRFGRNDGASRRGSAAAECCRSPGQTSLAVSLWPTRECPSAVVILLVRAQHMTQMPLAKHDHMIEALASDGADQSFSATVLPRRSRRCRSVANAHRANAARKCLAVDTVAITNEVVRHRFPPAGLVDLPGDPFGGWRCCDPNPKNSSAVMSEDLGDRTIT